MSFWKQSNSGTTNDKGSDLPELFIDRYKPKSLDDFSYNRQVIDQLQQLAKPHEVIPHLIFQGPPGSGKKTLALAFLQAKFGDGVYQRKSRSIDLNYGKDIQLNIVQSNYHYQINPSLHGVYDRLIVQDFIKNMVKYQTVDQDYRIIFIENADQLTKEAQQSLRRTLEKYINSCRFIFICNNLGNLTDPLQSRCVVLRVAAPEDQHLTKIIRNIATKEQIKMPPVLITSLINRSHHNLSQCLNYLENLVIRYGKKLPEKVKTCDYSQVDACCEEIVKLICHSSDLTVIVRAREKLYDLLVHCVNPSEVITKIFRLLLRIIPDSDFEYKAKAIRITSDYEHKTRLGSKPIYHLEGYVINLLVVLKKWALSRQTNSTSKNKSKNIQKNTNKNNTSTTKKAVIHTMPKTINIKAINESTTTIQKTPSIVIKNSNKTPNATSTPNAANGADEVNKACKIPTVVRLRRRAGEIVQDCDVYIGRTCRKGGWNLEQSIWHCPFAKENREEMFKNYRKHVLAKPELIEQLPKLAGKRLGCWCHPERCHGDVLIELFKELCLGEDDDKKTTAIKTTTATPVAAKKQTPIIKKKTLPMSYNEYQKKILVTKKRFPVSQLALKKKSI